MSTPTNIRESTTCFKAAELDPVDPPLKMYASRLGCPGYKSLKFVENNLVL